MNDEKDYWLAWSGCTDVGPVRFEHLLKVFGSAKDAWNAGELDLIKNGVKGMWLTSFLSYRQKFDFSKLMKSLNDWNVQVVTKFDESYPTGLREIEKGPFVLYLMGHESWNTERNKSLLAVVGTRKITNYGKQVTQRLVSGLVNAGLGIVSGLMYGVDEMAHRSCIESGGYTVGVWAGGLDSLFVGSRKLLAELVVKSGGVLVSEFPLGMQPSAQTFPYRNRIVAGMSCGVLVTEGSEGSGTLITAGYAAEQNKEVFAVPGPITSQQSAAPLQLIKAGAKLVTDVEDILSEIPNFKIQSSSNRSSSGLGFENSSDVEKAVLDCLQSEEMSVDELARKLKGSVIEIGGILSMMELKGWVRAVEGRWGTV